MARKWSKAKKEQVAKDAIQKVKDDQNGKTSKPRNRSEKRDQMKVKGNLNPKGFVNNPNWYFKDANQAEVMSRIQMNGFGAITKAGNQMMPTVMAFYTNPSVGVTEYFNSNNTLIANRGPLDAKALGINRAAQKLWYILTAKSGRAAGYSKADVAILIAAIGAMIETYEFIRRVFGIAYTYNQRNRALPDMLWKAMHVNADDYKTNAADYLKRMNTLMAVMNQLPIPGNVAWFAKCQDMFQKVFMDYPAEMAQLFLFAPSTTWILEENDGFIGGSYLRTVDMCLIHPEIGNNTLYHNIQPVGLTSSGSNVFPSASNQFNQLRYTDVNGVDRTTKTLNDYIDVFEEQINALLFSSSFAVIYADILRAFDTGTLSRWQFDYIDEKYVVVPEFNEGMLWQIHNASIMAGLESITRASWQSKWTGTYSWDDIAKYGTPLNDVYQWAKTDTLLYNPTVQAYARWDSGISTNVIVDKYSRIVDFPSDQPTTEERIELTRYITAPLHSFSERPVCDISTVVTPRYGFNYNLPDHWIEYAMVYTGYDDAPLQLVDSLFCNGNDAGSGLGTANNLQTYTKFHHAPLIANYHNYGTLSGARLNNTNGEINAWAELDYSWFKSISAMIYVDLFDIR